MPLPAQRSAASYGTKLVGLERRIRAGVLDVPGGPIIEIARLAPVCRPIVGIQLLTRTPPLYNAVPNAKLTDFQENIPALGCRP